jgi:hypothetical protein
MVCVSTGQNCNSTLLDLPGATSPAAGPYDVDDAGLLQHSGNKQQDGVCEYRSTLQQQLLSFFKVTAAPAAGPDVGVSDANLPQVRCLCGERCAQQDRVL